MAITIDESQLFAKHRTLLEKMKRDSLEMAQAMLKISQGIEQVMDKGGQVAIQPQIAFMVGGLARIGKDWGAVEAFQSMGVMVRPKMR